MPSEKDPVTIGGEEVSSRLPTDLLEESSVANLNGKQKDDWKKRLSPEETEQLRQNNQKRFLPEVVMVPIFKSITPERSFDEFIRQVKLSFIGSTLREETKINRLLQFLDTQPRMLLNCAGPFKTFKAACDWLRSVYGIPEHQLARPYRALMAMRGTPDNTISITKKWAVVRELELVDELSEESLRMLMFLMMLPQKIAEKVLQQDSAKTLEDIVNETRRVVQCIKTVDTNQNAINKELTHVEPKSQDESDTNVVSSARNRDSRRRDRQQSRRNPPRSGPNDERGSYKRSMDDVVCYNCGGRGHFQRDCPSRPKQQLTREVKVVLNATGKHPTVFITRATLENQEKDVLLDSGSMVNIISKDTWIELGRPQVTHSGERVLAANQEQMNVFGSCELKVELAKKQIVSQFLVVNDKIKRPIVGAVLIHKFGGTIDLDKGVWKIRDDPKVLR